ncbi:MAG: protein kinase [Kofleriaceae bacterium]|nr:protein kinase [Kofleriaceae bacterium]
MDAAVRRTLSRIAELAPEQWSSSLARAFPHDAVLRLQALLWLRADREGRERDDAPPSLGDAADKRYELLLQLAHGTTASVWQAFDRRLGRNIAIKVFHRANDSEALEQVLAEARAASDVISDHVVRVLDVQYGETHPYIVMELVCEYDEEKGELVVGATPAVMPPHSLEEALRWTMQVARGVHDAHARNVFHRDLKPRNVLISPKSRRARVADFGIAVSSAFADSPRGAITLMRRGPSGPVSIRGTPEYMAPEQARGLPLTLDARNADDRSALVAIDVWGIGALAYELVSGRPPWVANTVGDLSAWEIAASAERPPPFLRASNGARIPARVRRVIDKAMSNRPHDRYQTAAALAHDLQAVLAHRPTTLDRGVFVRARLWCQRNPQLALSAGILSALLVVVFLTHQAVTQLRHERNAIARELTTQRAEQEELVARMRHARATLDETTRRLDAERENLTSLERSLDEQRASYQALLETKEQALRDANRTTRRILEQLEAARLERQSADAARGRLERTVQEVQRLAEKAVKERDRVRRERETAQVERDEAIREREAIEEELERLKTQRERATRPAMAPSPKAARVPAS